MKYKITPYALHLECDTVLYQIQALKDIHHPTLGCIALAGDMGGYVYGPQALSQEGSCWVGSQAQVVEGHVKENAFLGAFSRLIGGEVKGDAILTDCALVSGSARVSGQSVIRGNAQVTGYARVKGCSELSQNAQAEDDALIVNAKIMESAIVSIGGEVRDATVCGDYLVKNESVLGINKGARLPYRYGCCHHSDNYEQERNAFEQRAAWRKNQWVERFMPVLTQKKYTLIKSDTLVRDGITLYRIKALRALPEHRVKRGDLGGYIQSESNLSHQQGAWVADRACVFGEAVVAGCALVAEHASVFGQALLTHECIIRGRAKISGVVYISDKVHVRDAVRIEGQGVILSGEAIIKDEAVLTGFAQVHDQSIVSEEAHLSEAAHVRGRSSIGGRAVVTHPIPRHSVLN